MDSSVSSVSKAVIKTASSDHTIEELLEKARKFNNGDDVIQLFDPSVVINQMHLFGAYVNAEEAFGNKTNISNNMAVEMLLFTAMTRQIKDAIKTAGAKSNKKFIVFANSEHAYNKIKQYLKETKDFVPMPAESQKAAKKFGINAKKELDQFVLQKITVSRLED